MEVLPQGTLSPGVGLGTLAIGNTLTLAGTAWMEISKDGSQPTNDSITGVTSLTYGGLLVVTNLGPVLDEGDSFALFSAGSYAGGFVQISLPALGQGLAWDLGGLAATGVIRVARLPQITSQPQGLIATNGTPVGFTVAATGTAPLAFQWRKDGGDIAGATNFTLSLPAVTTNDAAAYTVVVTNSVGAATSAVAILTVVLPPVITNEPVSLTVTNGGRRCSALWQAGRPR